VSTTTSAARLGAVTACSNHNEPEVAASPAAKIARPCTWWRTTSRGPRTPKVKRRFAAVLTIAVSRSAVKFAHHGVMVERRAR